MINPFNSPMVEEYRYIRYLLWQKGIKFHDINDELVFLIRKGIVKQIIPKDDSNPELIIYILHFGLSDQLILNTAEEYQEYLESFLSEEYNDYIQLKNRLLDI